MAGRIFYFDTYDLKKFLKISPYCIDGVLDIGANIGTVSIMSRVLLSSSRILAFEPCIENFDTLERNLRHWGVECYNLALGDGNPMCFLKGSHSGIHRFVRQDEEQWIPKEPEYWTDSMTLKQMIDTYKFDAENYIIKVDTEGGERHLLNDESINIVRGSVQFMAELHGGWGGSVQEWNDWFDELKDTHELRVGTWKYKETPYKRSIFIPIDKLEYIKRTEIMLVNKEWAFRYGI